MLRIHRFETTIKLRLALAQQWSRNERPIIVRPATSDTNLQHHPEGPGNDRDDSDG